ncbi:protein phosphatase 1 regulatory subunit 42, partial [Notothenia coriiceps]|uniref:Protein phosphatase 1 regulatory subunit 42 n=1 Tax=Notothenia coriiceps TaxID=8208 RepID=A0A6I9NBH6_9TELE
MQMGVTSLHVFCMRRSLCVQELEDVFSAWPRLLHADLRGNPVCKKQKYRDRLITAGKSLQALDGREISHLTRQFLTNWKASREAKKKKHVMSGELIPLTNDFNVGQGPHPGQTSFRPETLQRWKPQQPSL